MATGPFISITRTTAPRRCALLVAAGLGALCLAITACGGKKKTAGPAPQEEEGAWNTRSWPMTRGGGAMDGRVLDRVPQRPKVEWSVAVGAAVTSEVALAEGVMVLGDENGGIHAVDMRTRKVRWTVKTGDMVEATPAISGGRVFVGSDDRWFRALDVNDGRELWKVKGGEKFPTGAIVMADADGSGRRVLVNGYDGVTQCLRDDTGGEIWRHVTEDYINGSPVPVDGGLLVFGGCDAVIHGISLTDGAPVIAHRSDAQVIRSVASWKGVVFAVNHANQLVAVDLKAGKSLWSRENDESPFLTIPAVDGERVYVGSRDRHLHAFDLATGAPVWKFRTGARVESSALVFEDAVVFGSADGRLYALDRRDGREIWRLDLGEALVNAPAFAAGCIVIGGADGTVFVIREGGRPPEP